MRDNVVNRDLCITLAVSLRLALERKIIYQPETEDIAGTVKEYFADVIGESLNSDSQIR